MSDNNISSIDIEGDYVLSFDDDSELEVYTYPHKINAGMIIYIREGHCNAVMNVIDYAVKADDFIVVTAKSIFYIKSKSENLKIDFIIISPEFIDDVAFIQATFPLIQAIFDYPIIPFQDEEQRQILKNYYSLLHQIYNTQENDPQPDVIKSFIMSLLRWIISVYKGVASNMEQKGAARDDQIYRDLIRLIIDNYTTERSIIFYAKELCLTPKYLSSLIKKTKDIQISEIIDKAVILDAKTQLKTTSFTVLQISESLNFPNPSFFGRYFKKHTNMTPIEYRNS